jgi:hypothetical protein
VRGLDAEDLGAGVSVGVEMDEAERAVARGAGADIGLGDRVVAAEDDRDRARVDDLADELLDARRDASGAAGTTGASPKSTMRSSAKASSFASRCGPGGQLAARMARGANRAPGRSDTRSSNGAPTIATSTPRSSCGSALGLDQKGGSLSLV